MTDEEINRIKKEDAHRYYYLSYAVRCTIGGFIWFPINLTVWTTIYFVLSNCPTEDAEYMQDLSIGVLIFVVAIAIITGQFQDWCVRKIDGLVFKRVIKRHEDKKVKQ